MPLDKAHTFKPIAFITGAAGGIGRAAAEYFHNTGHRLWVSDHDEDGITDLARLYPDAITDVTDLTDPKSLEALCQKIEGSEYPIKFGFINAGVVKPGKVAEINRAEIDFHMDVNLRAAAHIAQALSQLMLKQGEGHIIGTISMAGMIALPDTASYSASKFGFRGYLLSLATELRDQNIYVSCIYPNAIDTPMLRYEAQNGGSALNFLSDPLTTADVVAALKRAVKGRKLEYFVPRTDYFTGKLLTAYPGIVNGLLPLLNRIGEKGRKKYIQKIKRDL